MTSNFELRTLAKIVHNDTIEKAQKRRFARSVKRLMSVTSDQCRQFIGMNGEPCHC